MRIVAALILLLLALSSATPAQTTDPVAAVEEILKLSGVLATTQRMPQTVEAQFAASMPKLPAGQRSPVKAIAEKLLRETFDPDAYYQQLKKDFLLHYDPQRGAQVLKWYGGAVSQKIRNLEDWICSSQGVHETERFAADPSMYRPTARRVDLIRKYLNATNDIQLAMDTLREMSYATLPVWVTLPPSRAETDRILADHMARVEQVLTTVFAVRYTYGFRTLTDDEIEDALRFLRSEAGRWFLRTFRQAWLATTHDRMHTLAVNIKDAVGQQK